MVERCASSLLMTQIMTWRNPCGVETNWPDVRKNEISFVRQTVVATVAQAGIALCLVASIVETAAYAVLSLFSAAVLFVSNKPFAFFAKKCESSAFTILWTQVMTFANFERTSLPTHESFARRYIDHRNEFPIPTLRCEDCAYLSPLLPLIERDLNQFDDAHRSYEDEGAAFLQKEIFQHLSHTIESLPLSFLVAKSVFLYSFTSYSNVTIPLFFKRSTRRGIHALRAEAPSFDPNIVREVERYFVSPSTTTLSSQAVFLLKRLEAFESEELQNGFYLTQCLERVKTNELS